MLKNLFLRYEIINIKKIKYKYKKIFRNILPINNMFLKKYNVLLDFC